MVDSGKVCMKRVLRRCRKQRLGKLGMVKHLRASNYRKLLQVATGTYGEAVAVAREL